MTRGIDQGAPGRRAGPPQARPDPLGGSLAVLGERGAVITQRLRRAGVVVDDAPLFDAGRIYVIDPFGNRLELIEPVADHDLDSRHVNDVRIAI